MRRRCYVLIVVLTTVVALLAVSGAAMAAVMLNPDSREALSELGTVTEMRYTIIENDTYKEGNTTYYPNDGFHYAIVYVSVEEVGKDGIRVSASDFKLMEKNISNPLAHFKGLGNGVPEDGSYYTLVYEVDKKFVLDDAELEYSGKYSVSLILEQKEEPSK